MCTHVLRRGAPVKIPPALTRTHLVQLPDERQDRVADYICLAPEPIIVELGRVAALLDGAARLGGDDAQLGLCLCLHQPLRPDLSRVPRSICCVKDVLASAVSVCTQRST